MKNTILFFKILIFTSFSICINSCTKSNLPEENSITIGGTLIVYKEDLGNFKYTEAVNECNKLGAGWRLPTRAEWTVICQNKEKVPNLVNSGTYWSSETNPAVANGIFGYNNGSVCTVGNFLLQSESWYTRPVKSR